MGITIWRESRSPDGPKAPVCGPGLAAHVAEVGFRCSLSANEGRLASVVSQVSCRVQATGWKWSLSPSALATLTMVAKLGLPSAESAL